MRRVATTSVGSVFKLFRQGVPWATLSSVYRSATCYPKSVESKLNADEFHFPVMQVQEKG